MSRVWAVMLCVACTAGAQEVADTDATEPEVEDLQEQVDAVEAKVEALLLALEQVAEQYQQPEEAAVEEPADDKPLDEDLDSGPPFSDDTDAEGPTPPE